jgi:hypothetical protein
MSWASWLKETPRLLRPSWTIAVKEQQRVECGRNVTLVSVGRILLDDQPRLSQSDGISVSMVCGVEGAGKGNRPLALYIAVTLEL